MSKGGRQHRERGPGLPGAGTGPALAPPGPLSTAGCSPGEPQHPRHNSPALAHALAPLPGWPGHLGSLWPLSTAGRQRSTHSRTRQTPQRAQTPGVAMGSAGTGRLRRLGLACSFVSGGPSFSPSFRAFHPRPQTPNPVRPLTSGTASRATATLAPGAQTRRSAELPPASLSWSQGTPIS